MVGFGVDVDNGVLLRVVIADGDVVVGVATVAAAME